MWYFTLLLLVAAVVATPGHEHAWETGNQYQYLVRSRTLSTLDQLSDKATGIIIKAVLTIQSVTDDKMQATLINPQFARIHTQMLDGLDAQLSDQQLQFEQLPTSGKPFEIIVKHGMIRDLLVDKHVPTWELNLLKGIVSQLQVDTQGENVIHGDSTQEPRDGQNYASYKTMEDTVGGKCEVLYDISPLSADDLYNSPELAPLVNGNNNEDQLIEVRKTKNYKNCKQQRGYSFGLSGRMSLTQGSNKDLKDRLTTKSSDSRIVISGDLKRFTIQSSVTTNHIFVKSEQPANSFIGTVYSKMNLTLVNMNKITKEFSLNNNNLQSTGNLLYTYNNPLTELEQGKQHQQTISRNSQQVQSSESSSSSSSSSSEQNHTQRKTGQKGQTGSSSSSSSSSGSSSSSSSSNGSSSSSDSSSSAASSSEEFQHLQTLPSLHEAPKSMTPLSLAFQDNQESLNVVKEAQKKISQIVNELQQLDNLISQETLEKFTNLVNLLRVMNENQIAEVEHGVLSNRHHNSQSDENTSEQNDAWNTIRDGVAQAGTGPALLTLIKWIQTGQLKGMEAARVIAKIPRVVRIPSETYIEAVFNNLVANQKVQQQDYVSKIAPIAFSELVRNAQVDKRHSQNAYPIYNFGKLNPKSDKDVTENYIPFMEKQLHQSLKNGDNPQAQVYIVALGNLGHPKVLRVFEPFLEGRQNVSTYLRTLMVSSLRSLVRRTPAVVAPVLYKIYLNDEESHEVRCAAVHLYMLTNPPLVSMLRMAKYTNFDKSNEVNAAVKSSIISLSKWDQPEFYHLSQKARHARRLLTSKTFSSTNSQGIFTETTIVQTIGSVSNSLPKHVYLNAQNNFDNIAKSILEVEYGVSTVRRILNIFEKPETHHESAWLDSLRRSIGMQPKTVEQVEGNLRIATIFGTAFYPFDQQSIEKLASHVEKNLKKDQHVHINHIDSYDETVSFPTESGVPFTFSLEMPLLTRVSMNHKRGASGNTPNNKGTNGIVNLVVAKKVQTRFGVVVSHVPEQYVAGVDRNLFVHVPVEYNWNMESKKDSYNFELNVHVDPEEQSSPLKLAHRSVVPFIAQINMQTLSPVSRGNMQRISDVKQLKKSTVRLGTMQIVSEVEAQSVLGLENVWQWWSSLYDESVHYRKVEVFNLQGTNSGNNGRDDVTLNVAYDESNDDENNNSDENENGLMHNSVLDVTDKKPNSAARRKQFLKEVSKGMNSVEAYVYDVTVELPFLQNSQVITISVGESNVERKTQYLVYWNQHHAKTGEVVHEALITGMLQSSQDNFLSYDKLAHQMPEDKFIINVRAGQNYRTAEKIQVEGRLLRSDSLSETLMKSQTVRQCVLEMQRGEGLEACQKAIDLALKKNLLQLSINMDSDDQNEIANMIVNYISEIIPKTNVEFTNTRNSGLRNQINMEVKMSPNLENAEAIVKTSQMNVKFQLHDSDDDLWQDENENFEDEEEEDGVCTVSTNEVLTFDDKNYPVYMGGIWHVLMIPDQLQILNHPNLQLPLSENKKVSVLTREQNNHLQVRVLLNDREYQLQQVGDHLQALINGQEVKLSKKESHEDKENGEVIAELFMQPDGLVTLDLPNHGITVLYDGKHVQLQMTQDYRNMVRGLCGNYDTQTSNDFLTPQNCVLQKPEEFSATFAVLNDSQDNNAKNMIAENKSKASRASCIPLTPRQTNVINDRGMGRELEKSWGHHQNRNQNQKNQENVRLIYRTKIDEGDHEICFSVRPLPVCPHNSRPVEIKRKNVAMHCMTRNDAAQEMKKRIQQGANPDLSLNSVSKKLALELPSLGCVAYLSFCVQYSYNIMKLRLILLVILGAAVADNNYAWETGNEYQFLIQSRTLTALDNLAPEFSGIVMKGVLTVQVRSPDTLQAKVSQPKYASVDKLLLERWDSTIPDPMLTLVELPLSEKPFEIKIKHGVIRDLLVDKTVATWELNLLKSIVSQLQIDTEGENAITNKSNQIFEDEQPFAIFKTMEDSVGGKCEVHYDITPLPEDVLFNRPELAPLPNLNNDGYLEITKTKNYNRCEQRMGYHFSMNGKKSWKSESNADGFLSILSTSHIVVSGSLKRFTIQSSTTTNKICVRPGIYDSYAGTVYSKINLTLNSVNEIFDPIPISGNLTSTGNLVYTYNNPFSDVEQRKLHRPSQDTSSVQSPESHSSESSKRETHSDNDDMFNSEERYYLQPKPRLDEVPDNPFLPYFVGYKGKSIQKSEKNNTKKVVSLLIDIGMELQHVYARFKDRPLEILDKFALLVRLTCTMNSNQIAEVENLLFAYIDEIKPYKRFFIASIVNPIIMNQTTRNIFRDVVAQAGTGPALITIINWIKNKKLEGIEAARIISKIPKTARVPTAEYIDAFFELITEPIVTKQEFLNVSAPLAFAELIYYSRVKDTSIPNRYPIHSFDRINSKHDHAVLEIYIPYMANQLREAIKEGDSLRIQTYIAALGNFGHRKILSIFEPYLEGKQPVSKFQRLMMVGALAKVAETNPELAQSVLYKIYLNTMDAHEVRCMAVYLLMITNPPLAMLQRMAKFTNYDESKHVNSVVKNVIENLAKLKQPEWQELVNKARIAKELLTPHKYGLKYSKSVIKNWSFASLDTVYKFIINTISGDDSDIPKAAYYGADISYGGFNLPTMENGYVISSIRQFFNMWDQTEQKEKKDRARGRLTVETIAQMLNIKPENLEQLEGNIFLNTMFGMQFYPFDNHTIEKITDILKMYFVPSAKLKSFEFGDKTLVNSYDITLELPTESGLPFVYTLKMSELVRVSGKGTLDIKRSKGFAIEANVERSNIVIIDKIESRIGFITPFEHRHYIAGIEGNMQLSLSKSFRVGWDSVKKNFQLELYPNKVVDHFLFHYSIIPYITKYEILDFESVVTNNKHLVHTKKPHEIKLAISDGITIKAKSDNFDRNASEEKIFEVYQQMAKFWSGYDSCYKMFDISSENWTGKINATYDIVEIDTNNSDYQQSWPSEVIVPSTMDKKPNSEIRRKQFLNEVSKGINSATAYILDIELDLPLPIRQALTFGIASSNVDEKAQALFYWNLQSRKEIDINLYVEACAAGQMRSSQNILLNFEKAIEQVPKNEIDVDLRFGNSYMDGERIRFKGYLSRSDDQKKIIRDSKIAEKCLREMRLDNKGLRACQRVTTLARWKDHLTVSMNVESDFFNFIVTKSIQFFIENIISDKRVNTIKPRNNINGSMEAEIKIPLDIKKTEISLYTPDRDIMFSPYNLLTLSSIDENKNILLEKEEEEESIASCTLDKTQAVTFDDKVYPLKLEHCPYVMMTTYSQENFNKSLIIPEEKSVAVMVNEMDDGSKKINMILGGNEILLEKSLDYLKATVNEHNVQFSRYTSYQHKHKNKTAIEIFELPDGSIRLISNKYGVNAVYDGERIRLEVSDKYRNTIRGLCGNYDAQPNNDFITPGNCILKEYEEFSAMYAMTKFCPESITKKISIAKQSTCIRMLHRQSNVINSREVNKFKIKNKRDFSDGS
nr:PREDICTED: uncharacterized protein LOC105671873 [Linepithema humile]